jgi:hypothetical protein
MPPVVVLKVGFAARVTPYIFELKVPTMASMAALAEKSDMATEMKDMMNSESEMDKWIPTAHGNECAMYELMRLVARCT